jgi:hypothetical protein
MFIGIFVILGVTSYWKGAVRSLVSLVGLVCALLLTPVLAPLLKPLVPKVGLANPLWSWLLPPAVVFTLFVLIFVGLSFFVHHRVMLHFKYRCDDFTRLRWERLNQRLGLGVGLIAATIYAFLAGVIIYVFGYPCVQVAGDESPAVLRYLKLAREQLKDNGLDRSLAALDPMPENYYLATDVLGLLYQNPALQNRLLNYPPYLALSERTEFQEIANDADLQSMFQTKAPIQNIFNHAKIQTVILSGEITQELKQTDLKDLYQYLKTGKSAKYEDEKILGRWKLDTSATLTQTKKQNPDMPAKVMAGLKKWITIFLSNVSLLATPDKKLIIKVEMSEEAKRFIQALEQAAAPPPPPPSEDTPAPPPQMSEMYMRRYGIRPGMRQGAPPPQAAPPKPARSALAAAGIPEVNLAGQGTWERAGDKYKIKFQDEKGKGQSGEAVADEDRLTVSVLGQALVFTR